MKAVKIGLAGIGTVGGGTYAVLTRNADLMVRRAGAPIEVSRVVCRNLDKARKLVSKDVKVSGDWRSITEDPEIDIAVELMGGIEPARTFVLAAIESGKHVVTANKALLAKHGNEIFEAAERKGVIVAFEAAVAGGIPIIKALREGLAANRVEWIAGIINGIADQTNIIAFNAELEASSAGSAGGNFSLVANEIRRLTNRTIRSTDEIRRRIVEIQHSSDALLSLSQDGSKKIAAGNQIIQELNARFEELKRTSETTDYASEDIKKIIEQQTASFAQIVITLRQISEAAETFSGSTQKISDSAQNLCVISEKLKNIQPDDTEGSAAPAAEKAKASEVVK